MKLITNAILKGACPKQRRIFRKKWPDGAPVTIKAAELAIKLGLDVSWLSRLLKDDLQTEYERQLAPLWAEYERQVAPLQTEYQRQLAPLWAEYERQVAPLQAEYQRQQARILVSLLWKQR